MTKTDDHRASYKRFRFAVAPMIDWTTPPCRFFHRQISRHALLYTEMVVADAVLRGDRDRLLGFDAAEHPVALQLGGSEPAKLAEAARIGEAYDYDEINLNVGCPSDRVQSGAFGACLMREPTLVGACLAAMAEAVSVPVTVKCRLGVDDQDTETALDALADAAVAAGVAGIWVHARKAWLQGLSPRENREIPPLDYDRVHRLKARLPDVFVGLNGGLGSLDAALPHLDRLDGVMLGRAAYNTPDELFGVDSAVFGEPAKAPDHAALMEAMAAYAERHLSGGGRMGAIAKPMTGLFAGRPGARAWRRILTEQSVKPGAGPEVIFRAFAALDPDRAAA